MMLCKVQVCRRVIQGVLLLLRPLLLDVVPSVSQAACMALGKMADKSAQIAEEIIKLDILPDIVDSITHQNVEPGLTSRDSSRNVRHSF